MKELQNMGAPTFEEFCKNRDKYIPNEEDQVLSSIDNGSHLLKRYEKKYKFEIAGFRTESLTEAQKIARDYNIPVKNFTAEIIPQGGGKCDYLVKFVSPEERQRRSNW